MHSTLELTAGLFLRQNHDTNSKKLDKRYGSGLDIELILHRLSTPNLPYDNGMTCPMTTL